MAHFDSIRKQKLLLKERLLQDQDIVNLLVNQGDNVYDFSDVPLGSRSPAASLIKTHFYVPGTTSTDKNFITMRSRIVYTDTAVVKEVGIVVYVICNQDQIDLMQGSRADLLADAIDRILNNGEPIFGIGGITLGRAEEVQFIEGYSGWEVPYVTHEFNRRADTL